MIVGERVWERERRRDQQQQQQKKASGEVEEWEKKR